MINHATTDLCVNYTWNGLNQKAITKLTSDKWHVAPIQEAVFKQGIRVNVLVQFCLHSQAKLSALIKPNASLNTLKKAQTLQLTHIVK